ncbi:MAG TPA: phosphoenolpyruvate--protein phosphotransferase [Candidatus Competibacteraceae bacterium]|nr:phosphoenolpyruvate--protein phosphotransferase [Candidatus Competibacteraceae bacterium]MCP5134104.1 phosphoenolpyruvate--protein phosphotransferase [Gammaproteobacteria bacterium]HPF59159.1 phosphoenolpyruvate--protein phosphotransferase [Candidatus Competibacteraceae bacterium]HRY18561.1 phosphoenolpyruvate--protein phosphotransferase [Candidatus Competibacteraceae bacterium]
MLDILRRIVQDINATRNLSEVLNLIVVEVKGAIHTDVCSVYMTDHTRGEHVLMATDGLRPGAIGKVRLKFDQGLTGLAASRAEPVNVDNAPAHPAFRYIAATGEAPFHGFIGVPIIRRRKVLGVLVAQQREQRKYTADEESFLVTLAAQLAGCITQAEIRQALERLGDDALSGTLFLEGIASAPGVALGEAVVVFPATALDRVPDKDIESADAEASRFRQAVAAELAELQRLSERMRLLLSAGDRALFDAYALLLSSDSLVNGTLERIYAGNWAPGALRATVLEYANIFAEMDDPYLRERAADILDLGQRLLDRLQDEQTVNRHYPDNTILMGDEIGVSQLLDVPQEKIKGLMSVRGTSTSHVALLARGLGIPAVFGVSNLPPGRLNGREVAVDGYTMRVCIQPSPALRQEYLKLISEEAELSRGLQHLRDLPAETLDGHRVDLYANSGLFADIAAARNSGVQGVGLYRSELHFFLRDRFPTEEEQTTIYTRVLRIMDPHPVVLRTLDIGGDKPLPYFPIAEQNPFLGWRGIRISLDQPDLFKTQLRAMLRAATAYANLSILFPMISTVSELRDALELLHCAKTELQEEGVPVKMPPIGMMVEVPSAVWQFDKLIRMVDFASIGSNDLTQYLLAVDRSNDRVAKLYDSLHPVVLAATRHVIEQSRAAGRPVSVCGEMAGDPAAALLLLAMGVDSLSMNLGSLLKIKWMIRSIGYEKAQALLAEVIDLDTAAAIRERANIFLDQHGLSGLLRVGK